MTEENFNEKKEENNENKKENNSDNNDNHPNHNNHNHSKHNHSNHDNHSNNITNQSNSKKTSFSNKPIVKKIKKELTSNYWAISTIVLAIVLLIMVFNPMSSTGGVIGEKEAGKIVLNFAEVQGLEAELVNVNFSDGLYEVTVTIQDQDVPVYLTSDGKNLVPSIIPIATVLAQAEQAATQATETPTPQEVPKSEKPTAELFIMTHCPYGTQAEKGFIPVIETLSEVADVKIRFVHYFMHEGEGQEPDETPIQVCIREEQSDKYIPYLKEFLKEGDSESSRIATGIDENALAECISNGKADEYYAEDSALSQQYGVGGSPTLVINGVQAQYGRNAASYLTGVCSAFNDAPEECSEELSTENPAPGFGYSTSGSETTDQC